jgi:hypothetical protein
VYLVSYCPVVGKTAPRKSAKLTVHAHVKMGLLCDETSLSIS